MYGLPKSKWLILFRSVEDFVRRDSYPGVGSGLSGTLFGDGVIGYDVDGFGIVVGN